MAKAKYNDWSTADLKTEIKRLKEHMKTEDPYAAAITKSELQQIARVLEKRR